MCQEHARSPKDSRHLVRPSFPTCEEPGAGAAFMELLIICLCCAPGLGKAGLGMRPVPGRPGVGPLGAKVLVEDRREASKCRVDGGRSSGSPS